MASAIVAAFTTLLIEYLAKPWLDARKERILEDHQRRRAAIHGLRRAAFLTGRMVVWREDQEIAMARDRTVRSAAEAEPLIAAAGEELSAPAVLDEDWKENLIIAAAMAYFVKSEKPPGRAWDELAVTYRKLALYADLFETARWRWWRRGRLIREIASSAAPRVGGGRGEGAAD